MRRLLLVPLAIALAFAAPALGQPRGEDRGRAAAPAGEVLPLGTVLAKLRGRSTGRLLDADLVRGAGDRWIYNLRMLERDGRVRVLAVDARSGEILGERGGSR